MNADDPRSDDDLLAATVVAPEAFGAFYSRHEEAVLRFFLRRTRDAELAADLTAETFAAALLGVRRYSPDGPPAQAWLFGIARHLLARARRRARVEDRARRKLGMPALHLDEDVIARIGDVEAGKTAHELLERLPAQQRDAVRGRILDEHSYEQLASGWRCSPSVVRKRVSRGLNALREEMGGLP